MKKVVVSGAGLVGSFWALALKKKGYDVDLFEKRSDMRLDDYEGGRSINLIATSRALNAFSAMALISAILLNFNASGLGPCPNLSMYPCTGSDQTFAVKVSFAI